MGTQMEGDRRADGKTPGCQLNKPVLNSLDHHVCGAMLYEFIDLNPKLRKVAELKVALQTIRNNLTD